MASEFFLIEPRYYHSFCSRGEGRANFVISAECNATGERIVWRLSRHRKSGTVNIKPKCLDIVSYTEKLIAPVIGWRYLVEPKVVTISLKNLYILSKIPALPKNLVVDTFDELYDEGKFPSSMSFLPSHYMSISNCSDSVRILQMIDVTGIPRQICSLFYSRIITIEIKPKQGFFQLHAGFDLPYCLNCILQLEKTSAKNFDMMYEYCPLDLYSGNIARMRKAIFDLLTVPHRNLRVFIDGTVIHSDEFAMDLKSLRETLFRERSITIEQLVTAICCILSDSPSNTDFGVRKSSIISRLLDGQGIDPIGIVQAHRIYLSLSLKLKKRMLKKCLLPRSDRSFMRESSDRALLERYFLAASFKDCSIMISLRLLNESLLDSKSPSQASECLTVRVYSSDEDHTNNNQYVSFAYAVKAIDFDPKKPKNLLSGYKRFVAGVKYIQEACIDRRPCL